jgi:hypothetical protein
MLVPRPHCQADGTIVERWTGLVYLYVAGVNADDDVVFGERGVMAEEGGDQVNPALGLGGLGDGKASGREQQSDRRTRAGRAREGVPVRRAAHARFRLRRIGSSVSASG